MEVMNPLTAVEPFPPALISRPGPACEDGEMAFQNAMSGKYVFHSPISAPDPFAVFSVLPANCPSLTDQSPNHLTPGRSVESLMEALTPSDSVLPNAAIAHRSRPGPVVSSGGRVFQQRPSGEYQIRSIAQNLVAAVFSLLLLQV